MSRVRVRPVTRREATRGRVRATAAVFTDPATGFAELDVYNVPQGFQFEVRRVFMDGSQVSENGANLNTAGASGSAANSFVRYQRSGTLIEYGKPNNIPGLSGFSVPGVQTWGKEEGPKLTGGETFQVRFRMSQASIRGQSVTVTVEGILSEVGSVQ